MGHTKESLIKMWMGWQPAFILAWCSVMAATSTAACQDQRDLLLEVGRLVGNLDVETEAWPGFEIPDQLILCSETGLTLVVAPGLPDSVPEGIGEIEETGAGSLLLSEPPEDLRPVCFDLDYRIGERHFTAVPLISRLYSIGDPVLANLAQFYHEAFHRFQAGTFRSTTGTGYSPHQEVRIPLQLVSSSEFGRLAQRERELLVEALREPEPGRKRTILDDYVAVREERLNLFPQGLRGAEAHHERKEGTATLVGLALASAAVGLHEGASRRAILADLRDTPRFSGDDYMSNPYRRWHIYATGSALGLLLDDLKVNWRSQVENGRTPYGLLLEEVVSVEGTAAHGG